MSMYAPRNVCVYDFPSRNKKKMLAVASLTFSSSKKQRERDFYFSRVPLVLCLMLFDIHQIYLVDWSIAFGPFSLSSLWEEKKWCATKYRRVTVSTCYLVCEGGNERTNRQKRVRKATRSSEKEMRGKDDHHGQAQWSAYILKNRRD